MTSRKKLYGRERSSVLTISKRWAIATGFVIVGAAIIVGGLWSQTHRSRDSSTARHDAGVTAAALEAPEVTGAISTGQARGTPPASVQALAAAHDVASSRPVSPASDVPHFDVVRVEPSGETVVAGQGAPNSSVDLMASGKVVGQASTDAGGHFVILPPALQPGDYALSLRQKNAGAPSAESTQSVVVSVPERGRGQVVVAMAEPGRATKLLSSQPSTIAEASPAQKTGPEVAVPEASAIPHRTAPSVAPPHAVAQGDGLAVRSVELENGSGFFASGSAAPGTQLHVYLNDSYLAAVAAGADGTWSVKIKKGLTGGHYVVRADAAAAGTKVAARVEVPFDVPLAMAVPGGSSTRPTLVASATTSPPGTADVPTSPAGSAAPKGPITSQVATAADAVIDEVGTTMVHRGDSLWDISRVRLGEGRRYTRIYAANVAQIRDPSLIYPGQVFVLPSQND